MITAMAMKGQPVKRLMCFSLHLAFFKASNRLAKSSKSMSSSSSSPASVLGTFGKYGGPLAGAEGPGTIVS